MTGATLLIGNIGGANISSPPNGIGSDSARLISTITFTLPIVAGTYDLGRTGTGDSENPGFRSPTHIGGAGTGSLVTNTSNFGFDGPAVATTGAGANGAVL